MGAREYCKLVEIELITWKAKIYDAIRKLEELPNKEKKKLLSDIKLFNSTISDIEEKIEKLKLECPSEWSNDRKFIEFKKNELEEIWYKYWLK